MEPSDGRKPPASLASMQVDVTARLGAQAPATPTGLPVLDRLLGGGLRTGMLVAISGATGIGKTALALNLAYMAARSKAAVLFASATLDETEIVARLASRALHREYPESRTSYGAIFTGQAWQDAATRGPVSSAVDTVAKKVGALLHFHRADPFESTTLLRRAAGELWDRHDRVVVVVDGIEAWAAHCGGDAGRAAQANSSLDSRVSVVAHELARLGRGAAVVVTVSGRHAELVAPAATFSAEMRGLSSGLAATEQALALGARPVDLRVRKNQLGPTGIVPLRFVAGAATFEEHAP